MSNLTFSYSEQNSDNSIHDADASERIGSDYQYFNETSAQLNSSYHFLEEKVKDLNVELDRVSAEKDTQLSEKCKLETRMQALLDFLPGGVIVIDASGRIVEFNPAAKDLLSVSLDRRLWRDVISESFAPKNDDGLEVSTKTGKRMSISTSSMAEEGQIILLTDQTETRKLQKNLSRHEKLSAMGKMVSVLAHQIRTPLSAAMLYAGHLNNPNLSFDKKSEFSKKVLSRLQHMERHVRDMMLFVKSELALNDVITMGDLEIGLREASEVLLITSRSRCTWVNSVPHLKIKCHREALISALMNLVNNGLQSSNDRVVELSITMHLVTVNKEERIIITVHDNGDGMTQQQVSQTQELFYTSKKQGTGLGLAVVKSVARAHGAQFRLVSQSNVGTQALFILPLVNTCLI